MPALRLDLHNHSRASRDSKLSIDDLIAQAKARGLDGFALTDHDSTAGNAEALEKARQNDLLLIPGCEVSSRDGHVLALFVEQPAGRGPLERVLEEVHQQDGLAVIAHPLRYGGGVQRRVLERCIGLVDGIEAYNPDNTPLGNRTGWSLAQRHAKFQTGGSDTHTIQNMAHGVTVVDAEARSLEGVREAMRRGRTRAVGMHAPPCRCTRCRVYYLLEPIGRSERFRSLPASGRALREANRLFGRLFFSAGRAMRW
ncbi:MAG TPA: CehA/McbA family metallohydrolase [Chloroflexota bacterium]|nr:CehA/McbA family metallohydrolase [Chloroflexota bacterium]